MAGVTFEKVSDNLDALWAADKARFAPLAKAKAEQAAEMMSARAPVSDINDAGYVHFKDQFRVEQIGPLAWAIFNDKQVGAYWLWILLEFGTRKMAPRKTVGPVMDIVGPQFLEEAGRVGTK